MNTNDNTNKNIITSANNATETKKTGSATVYVPEVKSFNGSESSYYNYQSGWVYENSYPSLKKEHEFQNVLTDEFRSILKADQKELKQMLISAMNKHGYEVICSNEKSGYIYAKGDIPVMLVAHMDTVHKKKVKEIYVSDYGNITSPQGIGGDDRCGVYMITQLLHKKPYILFTEDEEIGCLGAKQFAKDYVSASKNLPTADVKFIIELDRKGSNDMVFYNCDNAEFKKYVGDFGWDEKYGSNSDISVIAPVIRAAAVNLSCGYYKPHTTDEIINIDDVTKNLVRTAKMIRSAKKETTPYFKYVHKPTVYQYNNYRNYSSYSKTTSAAPEMPSIKLSTTDTNKPSDTNSKNEDKPKEVTVPQKSFKQILNEFRSKMVGAKIKA